MQSQHDDNRQVCAGMYSQKTWGGPTQPHILVKFLKNEVTDDSDPIASLIIFEWKDYDLVGVLPTAESLTVSLSTIIFFSKILTILQKEYICDPETINQGWCNGNQTGQFILAQNATEKSKNLIYTTAVHLKDPGPAINYEIKKTGYYCVGSTAYQPEDVVYSAAVEFRNAYGELPAAQIAKLPFYGGITIVYAVIGV
jgi:hypothetical protein